MRDEDGSLFPRVPYVIGELGCAHDGQLIEALRLVRLAARCGCDAVKIQYYDPERLIVERRAERYAEIYRRYAVPYEWLEVVADAVHEEGMQLVISTYDVLGLDQAHALADVLKVSSFECMDRGFLEEHEQAGKPLVISTGMTTTPEMAVLTDLREELSMPVYLLHCVSSYPVPLGSCNLSVIHRFGLDGWSDHSAWQQMGGWAVCAGAHVLEVHLQPASPDNPDWLFSLSEEQLLVYVEAARCAALAVGQDRPGRPTLPVEDGCRPFRVS